jgi:hypothetical protein
MGVMHLTIPQHVQDLINSGLEKVDADLRHHLNLGHREAIYWAFGPQRFALGNKDDSGYIRRMSLASQTILHILPIWETTWPENPLIQQILSKIQQTTNLHPDKHDRNVLDKEIHNLWLHVTELTDSTREIAGVVGMAAVGVYSLAVWDGFTGEDEFDLQRQDSDDFMTCDLHFYAAAAYANGPPYPIALASESDAEKRQTFWNWWLTQAVPEAWSSWQS